MRRTLIPITILVFAVIILIWGNFFGFKKINPSNNPIPKPFPNTIKNIENRKLPENFPSGIPLEPGAVITQNYNTVNSGGSTLAVREFISKRTLANNFSAYKNSLMADGWTTLNTVDASDQKIIEALKDKTRVRIRIYNNPDNQVTVSIQATTSK